MPLVLLCPPHIIKFLLNLFIFSSAVPSGSGDFQMPTCPSASSASTLRGGGGGAISETLG